MSPVEYITNYREDCVRWASDCLSEPNKNMAEDIVQDTVVSFLENPPEFDGNSDVRTFVFRAIYNDCSNYGVVNKNRRELEDLNFDDICDWASPIGQEDDPSEMLEANELEREIVGGLSDLERDIYILVLGHGTDYGLASQILGLSEAAVRQHVSRIKKKFNGKRN